MKAACFVAAVALIATPAFAADMPVKAPAPAPAAVYNWTGWYAGVNAGASFGNVKTDFNAASVEVTSVVPSGFSDTPGFAGSDRTYPSGFIGGGQIGYNWQYSPLIVVGLEADFQGAVERDHNTIPIVSLGRSRPLSPSRPWSTPQPPQQLCRDPRSSITKQK